MSVLGSSAPNFFRRAWRVARWPLLVIFLLYIALIVWRLPVINAQKQSKETVALIQSKHLTLNDVDGKHLPPPPDPKLADATVAGVDANQNGIRDDVELAIFKKYPNSPYTRAAELQYAMTEQMFLMNVSDSETWKAVAEEDGRASICLSSVNGRDGAGLRRKEVEDLVFNTQDRKAALEKSFDFITSHGSASGTPCDVDASQL